MQRRLIAESRNTMRVWCILAVLILGAHTVRAQDAPPPPNGKEAAVDPPQDLEIAALFRAGGVVGMIIVALSVAMVALIVEHLISIRRSALMPHGLAEQTYEQLSQGQLQQAGELCRQRPSFLGHVLSAGLSEAELDHSLIEKAMEDAATEQSARLFRKIEYLNVIGTLAPMLGLMGTVWGMIQAFHTFTLSANPQVAQLAPKISTALVTTLLGLCVAVPALGAFAMFRNRIDELVAESSLLAEHVFSDYRRTLIQRKRAALKKRRSEEA